MMQTVNVCQGMVKPARDDVTAEQSMLPSVGDEVKNGPLVGSRLNPDAVEFRRAVADDCPCLFNVDAVTSVKSVQCEGAVVPEVADEHASAQPAASIVAEKESASVAGSCSTGDNAPVRPVASADSKRRGLFVDGYVERKKITFLVDTGAEPTLISLAVLKELPKPLRRAFQDCSSTLQLADGQALRAQGPVMCNITVAGRSVLEAIYAAPIADHAILGLEAMISLGLSLDIAGRRVTPVSQPSLRRIHRPVVKRVVACDDCVVPARSEALIRGEIRGMEHSSTLMVGPIGNDQSKRGLTVARSVGVVSHSCDDCVKCENLPIAVGSAKVRRFNSVVGSTSVPCSNACQVRVLNSTDQDVVFRAGEEVAEAEAVEVLESPACLSEISSATGGDLPAHLTQMFEETCSREELSPLVTDALRSLLIKHSTLFAKNDGDLGRTNLVLHDIDTGSSRPIRQPARRPPGAMQDVLEQEMKSMLEKGVIEPGQSPWASPVVLVKKKDGSVRFCVDYRRLNSVTQFDAYPLPRIDETFEALSGARFFTTLDLLSGYWQVGLTPEARLKSAFVVRSGLYLWNVMPFGLCNAPSTFERLMETVLRGLQWQSCLVYLDDVVVFGRTEDELLQRMDEVFTRLSAAGLKLKPRKCCLFARKTDYLGHVISERGIEVSPEKVAAVRDWPQPEDATDIRSFLGTANYYRRFIRGYATIAAPLHRLTEKDSMFVWTGECQDAFNKLKEQLAEAPVLKFPVPNVRYVLDTDASNTGIRAVLSQIVDGEERVLGFASRTLSKPERNYCVTRRELLAVVHFVKYFRSYLFGHHFTIRTDHSSLRWLLAFKDPQNQVARWIQTLSEYDFEIEHRPGVKHGNADGLSRQPCRQCLRMSAGETMEDDATALGGGCPVRLIGLVPEWTDRQLSEAQEADSDLGPVIALLKEGRRPTEVETTSWTNSAKRLVLDWDRMKLQDGVLKRTWFDNRGREVAPQLVLPRAFTNRALEMAHDHQLAGHFGEKRTLARLREKYFWPGQSMDVRRWCRGCSVCCARRPKPSRAHHPLQQDPVSEPLQRVAVDLLGPLEPPTAKGNRYVVVFVDYMTKWAEAYPLPDQTAETVADYFVKEFVCRFGVPRQLHSDQGRQFESALFQRMCELLHVRKTRTTALHPQSDGQTERMNRMLLDVVAKLAQNRSHDWDECLPYAMAAYRSSVHSVTGETPNRLMMGREVETPLTLLAPPPTTTNNDIPWVEALEDRFRDTYATVLTTTKNQLRTAKAYHDRRQKGLNFEAGASVWLYDPKVKKGVSPKLDARRWSGPWIIVRKISVCVYVIRKAGTGATKVVNVDRLLPYVTRSIDNSVVNSLQDDNAVDESELREGVDNRRGIDVTEQDGSVDAGDHGNGFDERRQSLVEQDLFAESIVTTRAQRHCRKPNRFDDYCSE